MKVNHRAFTYKERRFNAYGRGALIDSFKLKFSAEKIQDHFLKQDVEIQSKRAKAVARYLEEEKFEERKDFITAMVETILDLANGFDITNIEAFAMTLHMYKHSPKGSEADTGKLLKGVNELRLTNWDKFMRILKEVS